MSGHFSSQQGGHGEEPPHPPKIPKTGELDTLAVEWTGSEWVSILQPFGAITNLPYVIAPAPSGGDDYPALSALIKERMVLLLKGGTYHLSAPLPIPNFFQLTGLTPGQGTVLRATGNNYCVQFNPGNQSSVTNLWIDAENEQIAGGGIDYSKAETNITIEDVLFGNNLFTQMNIQPTAGGIYHFNRVRGDGSVGTKWGWIIGNGANNLSGLAFMDCGITSGTALGVATPLLIRNLTDTIVMEATNFYQGGIIIVGEPGGSAPKEHKFTDCFFDGQNEPFNIAHCINLTLKGCNLDANAGDALNIGPEANGVRVLGGANRASQGSGIVLRKGSTHTTISGALIADNNQSNTAFKDGISVEAGTTDFTITGNDIGNGFVSATAHQKYGIQVAKGASNRYIIEQNRLFHNETAGLLDEGEGAEKSVGRNVVSE